MRITTRDPKLDYQWHRWFAWFPVEVGHRTWVWLEWVERRRGHDYSLDCEWRYRLAA